MLTKSWPEIIPARIRQPWRNLQLWRGLPRKDPFTVTVRLCVEQLERGGRQLAPAAFSIPFEPV
jgi:hypothetical protein